MRTAEVIQKLGRVFTAGQVQDLMQMLDESPDELRTQLDDLYDALREEEADGAPVQTIMMTCDGCGTRTLCYVVRPNPDAPGILALCETCDRGVEAKQHE